MNDLEKLAPHAVCARCGKEDCVDQGRFQRLLDYQVEIGELKASLEEHKAEAERLTSAVRTHRDFRGDDRCWLDDEELYRALPEGYEPPERAVAVELEYCQQFLSCRKNPATVYVSPQCRIEELEALVKKLREEKAKLQIALALRE